MDCEREIKLKPVKQRVKRLFILIVCCGAFAGRAQTPYNDFTVVLNEETLNKVFLAIGEIKGASTYEVLLIKGHYYWTVVNPAISIRPDSSQFNCMAKVEVGPFDYSTLVKGDVKISYENEKNEIKVKITRAIFEVYTVILGKKIHLKDIDLADYIKDPFVFEGPRNKGTDFEFTMPDSTRKHIYIQPSNCDMEIRWKEIVSRCEIIASDKPIKTPALPSSRPKETLPAPAKPLISGKAEEKEKK